MKSEEEFERCPSCGGRGSVWVGVVGTHGDTVGGSDELCENCEGTGKIPKPKRENTTGCLLFLVAAIPLLIWAVI